MNVINLIMSIFLTGQGVLLDRSVFSDTVFADVNFQQGTISLEGMKSLRPHSLCGECYNFPPVSTHALTSAFP